MKLYLAHYELRVTPYMSDRTTTTKGVRLVTAENQEEACKKMEAEYETGGPGDDSATLWNLYFEEAL